MRLRACLRCLCVPLVWAGSVLATAQAGGHDGHHHGSIAVDAARVPVLQLKLERDAMAGWNLHLVSTHFRFAPEHVNQPHQAGEGHAHIYVDGRKLARLYSPWFHLEGLAPGRHEIRVTLNANTHDELTHQGKTIAAVAVIE